MDGQLSSAGLSSGGLWVGIAGVDVAAIASPTRRLSDGAALDLAIGERRQEALDLVDPRRGCRGEVSLPWGRLANQSRIKLVLGPAMHCCPDYVNVEMGGAQLFSTGRGSANSSPGARHAVVPRMVPAFNGEGGNSEVSLAAL